MKPTSLFLIFLLFIIMISGCVVIAPSPTPIPTLTPTLTSTPALPPTSMATSTPAVPTSPPPTFAFTFGGVERDVTYCVMDGTPVTMDIYFPPTTNGPWPVIVRVHGGGWEDGDKYKPESNLGKNLSEKGFLFVAVNYRLAPEFKFPAMIEDIKCAVRYLRAHAANYNLDPNHIGAMGASAGGHVVSLLALADESAGWDVGEYLDQSSKIQAVVDNAGPTDLTDSLLISRSLLPKLKNVFGSSDLTSPILAAASPVNYVTPLAPPFFIAHGDKDLTVPLGHSQKLYEKLMSNNVPVTFIIVKGGGHDVSPTPTEPTAQEVWNLTVSFLIQYLMPRQSDIQKIP